MWCMLMHLLGHQNHHQNHTGHKDSATPSEVSFEEELLRILKRRYALGEITREQLEEMKEALGLGGQTSSTPQAEEHAAHV